MDTGKKVSNGVDHLQCVESILKDCRLGLISSPTGLNKEFVPTIDLLNKQYNLCALFSPEHGIRGNVQAGETVETYIDERTQLPVYSLYGEHKEITAEMLDNIDAIVFDIQDVGCRYYTFLYTLAYAMRACAKYRKKMIVLDRVNPIGGDRIEGNILNEAFASFVGEYNIPVRYGMTIGEFALYINHEKNIECDLSVVPCINYHRTMYFEDTRLDWVMPSPNIPTPKTILTYVGMCLVEGTNLSEGRGTTIPFEILGAPWLNAREVISKMNAYLLEGVRFREAYFTPTFSKYAGNLCTGIQIHITDKLRFDSFLTGLLLIDTIRRTHTEFRWLPPLEDGKAPFVQYLFGGDEIMQSDFDPIKYIEKQAPLLEKFNKKRKKYLLYEP